MSDQQRASSGTSSTEPGSDRRTLGLQLGLLLILFVLTRLALFVGVRPWEEDRKYTHFVVDDARFSYWTGSNLSAGNGFSAKPYAPFIPTARKPPGYSIFLSTIFSALGDAVPVIIGAQLFLQLMTLALIFFGARVLLSATAAFFLTLYCTLDPVYAILSVRLAPEILFHLINVLLFYLLLRSIRKGFSPARSIAIGLLLGGLMLTLDLAMVVLFTLLPVIAIRHRQPASVIARASIVIFVVAMVISPWVIRNKRVFGRTALSYQSGISLLKFYAAPHVARRTDTSLAEVQADLLADPVPSANPFDRSHRLAAKAVRLITEDALGYALFDLTSKGPLLLGANTKILPHLFDSQGSGHQVPAHSWPATGTETLGGGRWPQSAIRHLTGTIVAANVAMLSIVYALFVLGVKELWSQRGFSLLLLVLGSTAVLVAVSGPLAASSQRLLFLPFLLYGAGRGGLALWSRISLVSRRRPD